MARNESRPTSKEEMAELWREAVSQLKAGGFGITDQAIRSRVNTLLAERRLLRPSERRRDSRSQKAEAKSEPSSENSGQRRRKRRPRSRAPKKYYWFIVSEIYVERFMYALSRTQATPVYLVLLYYARRDPQTWVGQSTIGKRTGLSITTIRRAIAALWALNIIEVSRVRPGMLGLNGKPIQKCRGLLYRLNHPRLWKMSERFNVKYSHLLRK